MVSISGVVGRFVLMVIVEEGNTTRAYSFSDINFLVGSIILHCVSVT
jgi:hypothetical protein